MLQLLELLVQHIHILTGKTLQFICVPCAGTNQERSTPLLLTVLPLLIASNQEEPGGVVIEKRTLDL